jgi:hypothetical protein
MKGSAVRQALTALRGDALRAQRRGDDQELLVRIGLADNANPQEKRDVPFPDLRRLRTEKDRYPDTERNDR